MQLQVALIGSMENAKSPDTDHTRTNFLSRVGGRDAPDSLVAKNAPTLDHNNLNQQSREPDR
jgi:hypothetical protein